MIADKSHMNILYLHGLDSRLSDEKYEALIAYGEIVFPDIDYRGTDQVIGNLFSQYKNDGIDVIIGSSFGGFAAYFLSLLLNTDCLIFNPALPYRSYPQQIPAVNKREKNLLTVIGVQDPLIKAADNISFLLEHQAENEHSRIHVLQELAHQIPVAIFSSEVDYFFRTMLLNPVQ